MAVNATDFHRALKRVCDVFKSSSLYSEQEKYLEALFKGKDVNASLPIATGYGKSLIFFAAPIVVGSISSRFGSPVWGNERGLQKRLEIEPTIVADELFS